MTRCLAALSLPLALGACTGSGDAGTTRAAAVPEARAMLTAADGGNRGTASLALIDGGLALHVEGQGLPHGTHGIHVHTVGRCDAPDFQTAGAHWNPTDRQHGRDNPQGAHHGDLPNISVGAEGRGVLHVNIPNARWADLLDADGAAVVIHATADDYRTDPSGNSGARIACGVIERR